MCVMGLFELVCEALVPLGWRDGFDCTLPLCGLGGDAPYYLAGSAVGMWCCGAYVCGVTGRGGKAGGRAQVVATSVSFSRELM